MNAPRSGNGGHRYVRDEPIEVPVLAAEIAVSSRRDAFNLTEPTAELSLRNVLPAATRRAGVERHLLASELGDVLVGPGTRSYDEPRSRLG